MFIEEIQRRVEGHEEITVDGLSLHQWIEWAERRRSDLNPFAVGVEAIFNVGGPSVQR